MIWIKVIGAGVDELIDLEAYRHFYIAKGDNGMTFVIGQHKENGLYTDFKTENPKNPDQATELLRNIEAAIRYCVASFHTDMSLLRVSE